MSPARFALALLLPTLALIAFAPGGPTAGADELVRVTSRVSYDIRPDLGPVHVAWDVQLLNNDPQTVNRPSGTVSFYDSFPLPLLRGATGLSARSTSGAALAVTLDEAEDGPIVSGDVQFDRMLFYQETYSFTLEYDLPAAREESLLVTPYYIFIPVIASGDEATVSVSTPAADGWDSNIEPLDCARSGSIFTCSGSKSVHLAAFAEVSRPDATSTIPIDLALREKNVAVTITYFQGEEAWAQHLQELLVAALPVIEEVYGFPYSGPFAVNVAERGRQVILGYEGLTSCNPVASCDVAVSPIADDYTVLHELAHLWSDIYGRRWLAEGFADLVARETAARLPPGTVRGDPPTRTPTPLDLRLDEWGEVTSIIAASEEERQIEDTGYERSLRFLLVLEDHVGLESLQAVNAAITAGGQPTDSRRFMDTLEDVSGQNLDRLFAQWVFPDSLAPTLDARRQARDRLAALTAQAQAEGLSPDIPNAIREQVVAWSFDEALAALGRAEAALQIYAEIKDDLAALRSEVEAASLAFPQSIEAALARWDFEALRLSLSAARQALAANTAARQKVDAPRNLWERFGLIGSDPDGTLREAARAFALGDFQTATQKANDAAEAVDDASRSALVRLLIALGVLIAMGSLVVTGFWLSRRRATGTPEA